MNAPTRNWIPTHGDPYRPVPYRPARMPADESLARAAELRERMDGRRTVRQFSTDPVPAQVVRDAIACAATAPSGAHQQPWTFVLVKDPEVRRRIRAAAEEEEHVSYDGRLGEEWLAGKHYYVDESVGIAVGMLLSALHLSGLAALVHTPSPMRFLQEVLERPANEKAFAVIPVGYPAPDCKVPDLVRKSLDQVMVEV